MPDTSVAQIDRARGRFAATVRDWVRDPGGKAVVALIALAVIFLLWQNFGWGGEDLHTWIGDAAFLPVSITAAALAWRASRHPALDARTSRAWRIVAIAFFFYWVGDTIFTIEENIGNGPFPSPADAAYLVFYVVLLWGVLTFPTALRTKTDRTKMWLDTGTVVIGAFMILWYFALGPTARAYGSTTLESFVSMAYPIGDLVLVLAITRILLGQPPKGLQHSLGLLAAGIILFVIADVGFAHLSLTSSYSGGAWPDSLWMVAQVSMAASAQYQWWYRSRRTTPDAVEASKLRTFSPLPYLTVFASFGLLAAVGWHQAAYPLGGLMLGALGVTALVVCRQIAALRENLGLMSELHELANTDMLTGLCGRRHFFEIAEREFYLARRGDRQLAAMMIDIDHFKGINDTFGHAAGDESLQILARACKECLRTTDIVGRYGGDELVTILPDTDVDSALEVAARIRTALDAVSVEVDGSSFRFTISVGVATAEAAADLAQLLRRADRALYQAKQDGRNTTRALIA